MNQRFIDFATKKKRAEAAAAEILLSNSSEILPSNSAEILPTSAQSQRKIKE